MARAKKKTLDDVFNQVKDLTTNLGNELSSLQQNVNTVGQVAAGNSTATSAGSARAGLGSGGPDLKTIAGIALLGIGGWAAWKYLK